MAFYEPLRISDGPNAGRWHMCRNGAAVGSCADGCPGHATADEAREHFDDGLAATARISEIGVARCDVAECPRPASHRAMGPHLLSVPELCSEHANAEGLREAIRARRKT